ncbi:MAG: beta-glucosidase [Gemmatimonadetes bacterium]|nr:beta-glucosidase [Gemmatimonadota bacterium]
MKIANLLPLAFAAAACSTAHPTRPTTAPGVTTRSAPPANARETQFVDSLLSVMTLEEKIGQLTMSPAEGLQTGPQRPAGSTAQVRAGLVGSIIGVWGADRTHALQKLVVEESPHRIPLLFSLDVLHGYRTVFPVPLAEAASFDPSLAQSDARIAAIEATANGIVWTFAPMVDIARDPRWGRIVEGAGEEPYLGSVMAAARVRGFQGTRLDDPASMLATAKHYAGYGASEGGRDYATAELSERTFWSTYLPPFRAAISAGVGSIMPAFSAVNGSPPHASAWMLRDVLRNRLGFGGLVVSDWTAVMELVKHGVAATSGEAGQLAMRAGVDVDMSDGVYADSLPARARTNQQLRSDIDESARRVLRAKWELGLFSDPYHGASEEKAARVTRSSANIEAARTAARESIVLLKNDRATLPLSRDIKSLAVIGALAADAKSAMGSWTIVGQANEAVSVLDGLRHVNPAMRIRYAAGASPEGADTTGIPEAEALARDADAIVLVLGEDADRTGEAESRAFLELPLGQLQLAQRVSRAARGKPVVVVLMNGRPLAIPWIADSMPAIVESWYLGSEHGNAVADVLFGAYSPSGKLPVTFPRATGQVPLYLAHTNSGRPPNPSDKYTTGYNDLSSTQLFPFGFGLSYSAFRYGDVRLSRDNIRAGDSLGVIVTVSNVGARDADEVVQLYLRDDVASVARPLKQLVRFRRVHIRAGASETVTFSLGAEDLSFYDLQMRRVVEPGGFTLFAGTSSVDTKEAHFVVAGDTLVLEPATPRMQ